MFIPGPRATIHTAVILKQNTFLFARFYSLIPPLSKMADVKRAGLSLQSVVDKLEEFASTKVAEAWDNVGLLIDPMETKPVTKLLLTNDLTEDVMKEAIDLQVGMIVSYHPPIFKGLKTVSARTWKERIVVQCIRNGIALFSPHTSWDVSSGGVSDWLARALPIASSESVPENGAGRLSKLTEPLSVREAIQRIKTHTGMPHLRLALAVGKDLDSKISSMASCAGAGTSVLAGVQADLYLTGEMLHHDVLEAAHSGAHVVLCNHSDSERGFLKYFSSILQDKLLNGAVEVLVSTKDADPLQTV